VFPLLVWAVLVKLARRFPGILPYVLPWLRVLAWELWFSLILWGLYCLFAQLRSGIFFKVQALIFAAFGGTNFMYHWVRRRVNPEAYVKESDEGWWPSKREI
jgi:hypothetical protein